MIDFQSLAQKCSSSAHIFLENLITLWFETEDIPIIKKGNSL